MNVLFQTLQTIKGDVNRASTKEALSGLKSFNSIAGTVPMQNRVGIFGTYIVKAVRADKDNINWQPIRHYPANDK